MSTAAVLDIQGLAKQFKGKRGIRVDALRGLTMTVGQGEVFGFLGPNGAGKSTTIKCLMGLITPTAGSATIMGNEAGTVASRMKIGFLPENPAFYDYMSAEEYLMFVGRIFRMPEQVMRQRVAEVLSLLDLQEAKKRPMRGYSKGMVQRVGLAQALVHDPDVYILDEPMSGLDPIGRALVKEIILDLKQKGKTVFFSTHITDDVEKICDRVAVIVKGSLVALDRVESILRAGIEGYLVHVEVGPEPLSVAGIDPLRVSGNNAEFYVPHGSFNAFMGVINTTGLQVILVETKRRDLEDFFLSLVHTGQG